MKESLDLERISGGRLPEKLRCTKCKNWRPINQFYITGEYRNGTDAKKAALDDISKRIISYKLNGTIPSIGGMCTTCVSKGKGLKRCNRCGEALPSTLAYFGKKIPETCLLCIKNERAELQKNTKEKICSECKDTKSILLFGRNSFSRDGYQSICKSCARIKAAQYREANKEIIKDRGLTTLPGGRPNYASEKFNMDAYWERLKTEGKMCSRCRQTKPVKSYASSKSSDDGYEDVCRLCKVDREQESTARHKERIEIAEQKRLEAEKLRPKLGNKYCPQCEQFKKESDFILDTNTVDGLSLRCIDCKPKAWEVVSESDDLLKHEVRFCIYCGLTKSLFDFAYQTNFPKLRSLKCKECSSK